MHQKAGSRKMEGGAEEASHIDMRIDRRPNLDTSFSKSFPTTNPPKKRTSKTAGISLAYFLLRINFPA
jgi:hypothetical protein